MKVIVEINEVLKTCNQIQCHSLLALHCIWLQVFYISFLSTIITCSKLTIETVEQDLKYVLS